MNQQEVRTRFSKRKRMRLHLLLGWSEGVVQTRKLVSEK
jgi:hypothetical protein